MPVIAERTDLLRSVTRAGRILPIVISAALGLSVIAVPFALGIRFGFIDATLLIHLSMVVMLSGSALTLDDPAIATTRVLPISAVRVATIRMTVAIFVLTPAWVLQLALAPHLITASGQFDAKGLFIEAYGLLVWTWVVAWWRVSSRSDGSGAVAAAPALFLGAVAIGFLPHQIALFVNPAEPEFGQSRLRWCVLLTAGIVLLTSAMSRASGARRRRYRLRRSKHLPL